MESVTEKMQFTRLFFIPRKTRTIIFGDNAVRLAVRCGEVSANAVHSADSRVREERKFRGLVNLT